MTGGTTQSPIRRKIMEQKDRNGVKRLNGKQNLVRPLDTLGGVRMEMARVYRAFWSGEVKEATLPRLIYALDKIRGVIEAEQPQLVGGQEMRISIRTLSPRNEPAIISPAGPEPVTIEHEPVTIDHEPIYNLDDGSDIPK